MVRAKKDNNGGTSSAAPNPEAEERHRLKSLAFSHKLLSQHPPKPPQSTLLTPSKTLLKHHGADILKKSTRKNRFLFSFPGLIAPISGGKIGHLMNLGTKNPILYLNFPQGQMKLLGTIVYPKNRYLTLQFSKGGKNVMCEDYFDNMIVFSDAWWIGTKDENPEELRLEFPKELTAGKSREYDFKGGAGSTTGKKHGDIEPEIDYPEPESPKVEIEEDLSNATPVRQSRRTAGKKFNFAENFSGGESEDSDAETETSKGEETNVDVEPDSPRNATLTKTESVDDIDNEDAAASTHSPRQAQQSVMPVTKSKEVLSSNRGSLVQASISTLFKKVEEKKASGRAKKTPSSKVSGQNKLKTDEAQMSNKRGRPKKQEEDIEELTAGTGTKRRKKNSENLTPVEPVKVTRRKTKASVTPVSSQSGPVPLSSSVEDDIEDFSSSSQDTNGSDEDWDA